MQDDGTVFEVLEEVVNAGFDVQTVEPEGEDTGFALSFRVKVLDFDRWCFLKRLEARPGVEEMRNKRQVQLGISSDHRSGSQVLAATDGVSTLKDHLCSLHNVALLQRGAVALIRFELAEQDSVVFTVGNVLAEVGDTSVPAGSFEVVVDPSKQNLIRWQAQEFLQRLTIIEQTVELRVVLQVDLAEQTTSNDLPYETKNQVLLAVDEILRTDVNNAASNSFSGGDDNVVIFGHLESVGAFASFAKVEYTLIDGIRHGIVDKLAENETVSALVEELEGVGWDRKARSNVRIAGETRVDVTGELGTFILVDSVLSGGSSALDKHLALGDDTC